MSVFGAIKFSGEGALSIKTQDARGNKIKATVYELDDDGADVVETMTITLPDERYLEDQLGKWGVGSAYVAGHFYAAMKAAESVGFDGRLAGAYHGPSGFVFVSA